MQPNIFLIGLESTKIRPNFRKQTISKIEVIYQKKNNISLLTLCFYLLFSEWLNWFLTLKIDFENQILALFDVYFWPFNKSHEKINIIFVISAIIASIWNVFIKFRWHDEKLTLVFVRLFLKESADLIWRSYSVQF